MTFRRGPYVVTIARRTPRPSAQEFAPVPHAEGSRRLREEVMAAIPVDDEELAKAKRVGAGGVLRARNAGEFLQ